MDQHRPRGLTQEEMNLLSDCLQKNDLTPEELLEEAENHLERAIEASKTNVMVNVMLAEAIVDVFRIIVSEWEAVPEHCQKWCMGMICYFSLGEDEIDDFESPIGFEDDTEVVNAVLRMIDREDLCLVPEDFDEE